MSSLSIVAQSREEFGKGAMRRLRRQGQIPGVIYGGDTDPVSIQLRHDDVLHSLENEVFYSSILNLELDGKKEKVVLRDVQRHPSRIDILHTDFQRVSSKTEITMSVPLHYINADTAKGIKLGGILDALATEVSVRCLPKDLPESIEVDVADLEIGQFIHLSQIKLPDGVILSAFIGVDEEEIGAHDQAVVAIHEAKVEVEEPELEEGAAEDSAGDAEVSSGDADTSAGGSTSE